MKVVLVTGGFDPLHSGHIEYFKEAKKLGDILCVGINSDEWLTRKKGRPFMSFEERKAIVENIKSVGYAFSFDDQDDTAIKAIEHVKDTFSKPEVVFANGGDRTKDNVPEMVFDDVQFTFGVGGTNKMNSSSWILKEWSQPTTERAWGRYTVLEKGTGWQVKKLQFDVNKSLSDQRHFKRSEHWHVIEGSVKMALEFDNGDVEIKTYTAGDSIDIPVLTWHKATNVGDVTAKVIEVWMGDYLDEDDIQRRD